MSKLEALTSINPEALETVAGGASSDEQLQTALASISTSIKDIAGKKDNTNDQLMPMMFMMMAMGGGGGGGGTVVAPAPVVAGPTIVKVNARFGRRW
jgi:hypothetical protein